MRLPFCPSWALPLSEELPQVWRPLLSSDPPRVGGPIPLLSCSFPLFSLVLPGKAEIFLVPILALLDFQGPLLVFSWDLCILFHF